MKIENVKKSIVTFACLAIFGSAVAEQTVAEKTQDAANDVGRSVKKGANRIKEAVCMKSDAKCLAKKAKNRIGEAADAAQDKAKEVKDKLD